MSGTRSERAGWLLCPQRNTFEVVFSHGGSYAIHYHRMNWPIRPATIDTLRLPG